MKLIINNHLDLIATKRVNRFLFSEIKESKNVSGLKIEDLQFESRNNDSFWNWFLPNSYFYKVTLENCTIELISDNNFLLYSGYIDKIEIDDKSNIAKIITKSLLSKMLEETIFDLSLSINPINAIINQLIEYRLENYIDYPSFNRTINWFNRNSININCQIMDYNGITLFDFINKLCELLNINIYINKNKIICSYFDPNTDIIIATEIKDKDIIDKFVISVDNSNIVNNYNITTGTGIAIDRENENLGYDSRLKIGSKSYDVNADFNSNIQLPSINQGYTLGNNKIRQHLNSKTYIEFSVLPKFIELINIGDYIGITYSNYNWNNKIIEIIELNYSINRDKPIKIKGIVYDD